MEQRKDIRTAIFAPVEVGTGKLTCHEFIQDISFSGAFIETQRRLPVGERLMLSFTFPSYPEQIHLSGRVVRNGLKGIGVQFLDASSEAITIIRQKATPVRPTENG
jgi:Tfp pilus assembly protein PilZ